MTIEANELERILEKKELGEKVDELSRKVDDLIKRGVGIGTGVSVPDQASSSQQPQRSTAPSDSKNPEKEGWDNFFTDKNITDPNQQISWKETSGLNYTEAQIVWDNEWRDLTANITNLGNKQASCTSKGETTDDISLLRHKKKNLDEVHRLIQDIKNATLLSDLPGDSKIKKTYEEKLVPDSRNYQELRGIREDQAKKLFKQDFELGNENHGLSEEEIEQWRTSNTGLRKNGIDERIAFNNNWNTKIAVNQDGKYDYNGQMIDVLQHDKREIDKANDLIEEAQTKTTFRDLDTWKVAKKEDIDNLKDSKLPASTYHQEKTNVLLTRGRQQKDVWEIVQEHRSTFVYKINEPNNEVVGDGLTPERLTEALKIEEKKYQPKKYGELTANILNQFLNVGNPIKVIDETGTDDKNPKYKTVPWQLKEGEGEEELDEWLTSPENKGFKIDEEPAKKIKIGGHETEKTGKEIVTLEEELSLAKKGTYLLPFFYDKMNFDIDAIRDKNSNYNKKNFCSWEEKTTDKGKVKVKVKVVKAKQGELAIGTGVGKTTKTACCLCRGGKENIILVCPTEPLVNSAYNHHKSWLQKWGCVYHAVETKDENGNPVIVEKKDDDNKVIVGKDGQPVMETVYESHGSYEVAKNDLCYWIDGANVYGGKKGVSIMEKGYLLGFLARSLYKNKDSGIEKALKQNPKLKNLYPDFDERVAEIKTRLIPKNEAIIIFDEAHYASPTYQELIRQTIFLGYNVIKMSATFKGKPFSITSSYPIENTLVKGFNSSDDETLYKNGKTLMFLNNTKLNGDQKKILEDNKIPYVVFDESNSAAAEGISFGMPKGCLLIVNPEYEMGFTFDADTAIITDWIDLKSLGKFWIYGNSETQRVPIASWGQERGRVGRIRKGFVKALSNDTQEIDSKTDLAQVMVRAILTGSTKELEKFYSNLNNANYLRGAISLSGDKYKFGKNPEEILIGLKGQPAPIYPTFDNKPEGNPDKELWERHQGIYEPEKMPKDQAREILSLTINTFIKNQTYFPKKLEVDFDSTLIKETDFSVEEARAILNGVIEEKLNSLPDYRAGETKYKNENTFKTIVGMHKLSLGVDILIEDAKEKTKKVLKIIFPKPEVGSKKTFEKAEISAWRCEKCLKVNNYDVYCETCGIKKKSTEAQEIYTAQFLHDTTIEK